MSRGRVSVIRDPAIAVAAAKCWMARWHGGKAAKKLAGVQVNSFHPEECGFCEFPTDRLIEAVTEFRDWAGLAPPLNMDDTAPLRATVEAFLTVPAHEQHRLVRKAQGYEDDPENDRADHPYARD